MTPQMRSKKWGPYVTGKTKPCGNPECCATSNIAEEIEHGWGNLDFNGFWEFPCDICNKAEASGYFETLAKDNK